MYNKFVFLFAAVAFVFSMAAVSFAAESYNRIPESAFSNCVALSEFEVQDYVDYIDEYAFEGCTSLGRVDFRNPSTVIADTAFDGVDDLYIFCYKNSTAHKFALDNGYPFELYEYDSDYKNDDFDFDSEEYDVITTGVAVRSEDSDEITTRSAVIVDGTVSMGHYKLVGDQKDVIEIIRDEDEVLSLYMRSSDDLVSSGSIEVTLNEDDEAFVYIEVLEDGTKLELDVFGEPEERILDKGKYTLRFIKTKDAEGDTCSIRVSYGEIKVAKLAFAQYTEPVIGITIRIKYGDADLTDLLDATDAAIVLTKVRNAAASTLIEKNYGADVNLSVLDVDMTGVLDATDAASILTHVRNHNAILKVVDEMGEEFTAFIKA